MRMNVLSFHHFVISVWTLSVFVVPACRAFTPSTSFVTSCVHPFRNTCLFLFWFSSKKDERPERRNKHDIGGVAQVMDSMEQLRKVQDVGKVTANIMEELERMSIEGSAADGKVKVIFDGQRRPKGVEIDDSFLATADTDDVQSAITKAMKEAYTKSGEKMDDKLKALYAELGLSTATTSSY